MKDFINRFVIFEVEKSCLKGDGFLVCKLLVDVVEFKWIECDMKIKSWYGFLDDYDFDDDYDIIRCCGICLEEEDEDRLR